MNSDLEFQLYFQQSKLQVQIQRELRLLEPELQRLKSKAELLLFDIEDRTTQLKTEQQKLKNLQIQHEDQEHEADQLKKYKDALNQLMHTHNITHNEVLQLQKLYNQSFTYTNTHYHQPLRHI